VGQQTAVIVSRSPSFRKLLFRICAKLSLVFRLKLTEEGSHLDEKRLCRSFPAVYGQQPGARPQQHQQQTEPTMTGNKMENLPENAGTRPTPPRTGGFCRRCGREHWLGPGNTQHLCLKLIGQLNRLGTIDLFSRSPGTVTALRTDPLFGAARGKMFGIMECLKPDGTTVILYAFSGQFNGLWLAEGWAPPLFELSDFLALTVDKEKQIKQLGREIDSVCHIPETGSHRGKNAACFPGNLCVRFTASTG
jgi:hypothetical protein